MSDYEEKSPLTGKLLTERYGVRFNGEAWVLIVPLAAPLEETAFAAGLAPEIVLASAGRPTGMQMLLLNTPYGSVLRFSIVMFDDLEQPFELRLPVNPAPQGAAEMLSMLAGQETVQILFFDASSGEQIGRRILPFDFEQRQALQAAIVYAASEPPSSYERWMSAVGHVMELL